MPRMAMVLGKASALEGQSINAGSKVMLCADLGGHVCCPPAGAAITMLRRPRALSFRESAASIPSLAPVMGMVFGSSAFVPVLSGWLELFTLAGCDKGSTRSREQVEPAVESVLYPEG